MSQMSPRRRTRCDPSPRHCGNTSCQGPLGVAKDLFLEADADMDGYLDQEVPSE